MKLLLMADQFVGLQITTWMLAHYKEDLAAVVTISENEIFDAARAANVPSIVFESAEQIRSYVGGLGIVPDVGMLAWWPKLIPKNLLTVPTLGFINTHPSFLPHNRGKHYNFWALVEQAPYGVSLHFASERADEGDIVAQKRVPYSWEDNGATLYSKAREAMVALFEETYPKIRTLEMPRQKQDLTCGSFHFARELEGASHINLDQCYLARDLLNLIRARTFPGHPACWFVVDGSEYEVRIEIKRKPE